MMCWLFPAYSQHHSCLYTCCSALQGLDPCKPQISDPLCRLSQGEALVRSWMVGGSETVCSSCDLWEWLHLCQFQPQSQWLSTGLGEPSLLVLLHGSITLSGTPSGAVISAFLHLDNNMFSSLSQHRAAFCFFLVSGLSNFSFLFF